MKSETPLEVIIKEQISRDGPMPVGKYMEIALTHPDHGYYMGRDPLGRGGDFTTAPEISQMFGEMIGIWCADLWLKAGQTDFILCECGPGRGTLMADLWRGTKHIEGFQGAANIHFVEASPLLKEKQREAMKGEACEWHADLSTLPTDKPIIFIANEFFDALPIEQIMYDDGTWREVVVEEKNGILAFGQGRTNDERKIDSKPEQGDVYEYAPIREEVMRQMSVRLNDQGGAALIIDYGHVKSAIGDTLQAVKGHKFCDVLSDIGNADITSHVDFEALKNAASKEGSEILGPVTQSFFLMSLGISVRAQILKKAASDGKNDIESSLARLISAEGMGELFKVIGVCGKTWKTFKPEGFK